MPIRLNRFTARRKQRLRQRRRRRRRRWGVGWRFAARRYIVAKTASQTFNEQLNYLITLCVLQLHKLWNLRKNFVSWIDSCPLSFSISFSLTKHRPSDREREGEKESETNTNQIRQFYCETNWTIQLEYHEQTRCARTRSWRKRQQQQKKRGTGKRMRRKNEHSIQIGLAGASKQFCVLSSKPL